VNKAVNNSTHDLNSNIDVNVLNSPIVHQQISDNIVNQHNQTIHQTNTQLFSLYNPNNPLGIVHHRENLHVEYNNFIYDNQQDIIQNTIDFINLCIGVL
jgi:bifunctional pyridoxal-dependent enzyme with beta-cystathionase and maltose regulon repressor activities